MKNKNNNNQKIRTLVYEVFLVFRQPLFHPPPQTFDIAVFLCKHFAALPWGCCAGMRDLEESKDSQKKTKKRLIKKKA